MKQKQKMYAFSMGKKQYIEYYIQNFSTIMYLAKWRIKCYTIRKIIRKVKERSSETDSICNLTHFFMPTIQM